MSAVAFPEGLSLSVPVFESSAPLVSSSSSSSSSSSARAPAPSEVVAQKIDFQTLTEASKLTERKAIFAATKNAFDTFLHTHSKSHAEQLVDLIQFKDVEAYLIAKATRLFVLLFMMSQNLDLAAAQEKVATLKLGEKNLFRADGTASEVEKAVKALAESEGIVFSEQTAPLLAQFTLSLPKKMRYVLNERRFQQQTASVKQNVKTIEAELRKEHQTTDDYRRSNRAILYAVRAALDSPCYQMLKTNEHNLLVQFLHTLCLAQYSDVQAGRNFTAFGSKIKQSTNIPDRLPLATAITRSWNALKESGFATSVVDSTSNFSGKELVKLAYNYSSYAVTAFTGFKGYSLVDERVLPDNIPGSLYDEKLQFTVKDSEPQESHARAVYTCSPTVGSDVSSEFRAVLQAMENRQFTRLNNDPYPVSFWAYTNLQDLANSFESPQALALPPLNEEFPLSFRGISVAQNSPFYRDDAENAERTFDAGYRDAFLRELCNESNFTLVNRLQAIGGGYFFPSKDKERWGSALDEIAHLAYTLVDENRADQSVKDLRSAFRELVHLGIMRYHQKLSLETLSSRTNTVAQQFFDSRICKSAIDRGGKNTIMPYAVLSDDPEVDTLTLGALHGRPLHVGRRLIFENYAGHLVSLTKVVPKAILQRFLATIGETVDSESSTLSSRQISVI